VSVVQVSPDSAEAQRREWLAWRRGGIGASDAAAVCGLDAWRSPLMVWLDKTGALPDGEDGEPEWLRWGRLLEPAMIDEFEHRTGLHVAARQTWVEHPDRPWQRATLDGLVYESPLQEQAVGIYEGKTASWRSPLVWTDAEGQDQVPDQYRLQALHAMLVTQTEHAWLAVLHNGNRLGIHELTLDPEEAVLLLEIEERFWQRVIDLDPPPADAQPNTAAAIRMAYAEPDPESVLDLDEEGIGLVLAYRDALAEQRRAEDRAEGFRNRLMAMLGEREIGMHEGSPVVTWKGHQTQRVDLDRLRQKHPRLVGRFTTTSTVRRLVLPKERGSTP
jgi:putative phage-type endonuclease